MSVFELPTVTLIPNGIHHPPIEDGRLLPNSVKDDSLERAYQVPGGKVVKVIVACLGLLTSLFAFCISFVPPASIAAGQHGIYETILIVSYLIVLVIPFTIYACRHKFQHAEK